MSHEADRRARAAARETIAVRKVAFEDEAAPDYRDLDRSERVALVWSITLDAWASGQRPIPDYPRSEAPGRVLRRSDGAT